MFLPNPQFTAFSGLDNSICIYDSKSEDWIKKFTGHKNEQLPISINYVLKDNKSYLLSGSENPEICLWDMDDETKLIKKKVGEKNEENAQKNIGDSALRFDYSPKTAKIVLGGPNQKNEIYIYDIEKFFK